MNYTWNIVVRHGIYFIVSSVSVSSVFITVQASLAIWMAILRFVDGVSARKPSGMSKVGNTWHPHFNL